MINEEEKKAIETLKRIDIKFFLSGSIEQSNYIVDRADEINKYIEILLNLIEKQAKEIEELKGENYGLNNIISDLLEVHKENEQLQTVLNSLRDELVGDRMEQFDDYVIYLQSKYLKMLGEEDNE